MNEPDPADRHERMLAGRKRRRHLATYVLTPLEREYALVEARAWQNHVIRERSEIDRAEREKWEELARLEREQLAELFADLFRDDESTAEGEIIG